jgi:hypothetical protein
MGWAFFNDGGLNHLYFAYPVLFGSLVIVVLGVASRSAKRRCKWNTKCALKVTIVHKLISYLIILSGFIAIYTGIA